MDRIITSTEISSTADVTQFVQSAIDQVSKSGGGMVHLTAGHYQLTYLDLKSHVDLNLAKGAYLSFSDHFDEFPAVSTRYEGTVIKMRHPDIYGDHVEDVSVTGAGVIDGCGQKWWELDAEGRRGPLVGADHIPFEYSRPFLMAFDFSKHIRIEGVKLINSPAWTVHPLECEDVVISGVTIDNPLDSPNTDGIDPESCTDVKILGNTISDGDDCIAIKSGIEVTDHKSVCQNIIIANNIMKHGHGGVVFGSEMSGGIENVIVSNNIFDHTDRGIRMKTRRGRGGFIRNITISDILMRDVLSPLTINEFYGMSGAADPTYLTQAAQPVNEGTPHIADIRLANVTATGVRSVAAFVYGLPESMVENLSLTNYRVTLADNAQPEPPEMISDSQSYANSGLWMENTNTAKLTNVEVLQAQTDLFVHKENNSGLIIC